MDGPASKAPEIKKSTQGFEVREAPSRRISTTKPPPMAPLPDLTAQPAVEPVTKATENDVGFVEREELMKKRRDSRPFKSLPTLLEPSQSAAVQKQIKEETSSPSSVTPSPITNGTTNGHHGEGTVEVMLKFNVGTTVTLPKGFTFAQLEWAVANQQMPTSFEFRLSFNLLLLLKY